jgi:hypothetical protein
MTVSNLTLSDAIVAAYRPSGGASPSKRTSEKPVSSEREFAMLPLGGVRCGLVERSFTGR